MQYLENNAASLGVGRTLSKKMCCFVNRHNVFVGHAGIGQGIGPGIGNTNKQIYLNALFSSNC